MKEIKGQSTDPALKLTAALSDALSLIEDGWRAPHSSTPPITPQPGLLQQCLAMCEEHSAIAREPIRTVHHFACSGGTLISSCIAAMPNVQLLSEIDPLSSLMLDPRNPRFAPTDPVTLLRQGPRKVDTALVLKVFREELRIIYEECTAIGQHLVLRDHSHSQFCTGSGVEYRPTLRELAAERHPVLSLVTVRHPLDSYTSLVENGWVHFQPGSFEEYCNRYSSFLDRYSGIPRIKYESFVKEPVECMSTICKTLGLSFNPDFSDVYDVISLTGNSGRKGLSIEPRTRRQTAERLAEESRSLPAYVLLCHKMDYSPSADR